MNDNTAAGIDAWIRDRARPPHPQPDTDDTDQAPPEPEPVDVRGLHNGAGDHQPATPDAWLRRLAHRSR